MPDLLCNGVAGVRRLPLPLGFVVVGVSPCGPKVKMEHTKFTQFAFSARLGSSRHLPYVHSEASTSASASGKQARHRCTLEVLLSGEATPASGCICVSLAMEVSNSRFCG